MMRPFRMVAGVAGVVAVSLALAGACASSGSGTGKSGTTSSPTGTTSSGGAGGATMTPTGAGGGGGGTGGVGGQCASVDSEASQHALPVDIVMAIDSSDSMFIEVGFVQFEMNSFVNTIAQAGIDAHVVLVSEACEGANPSQCPDGNFGICIPPPLGSGTCSAGSDSNPTAGFWHLDETVLSREAYQRLIDTYDDWSPHLRADSVKHVIVISDDNDDHTGDWFKAQLALEGATWADDFTMNGIVSSQGYAECMLTCSLNCGACPPCCALCLPISAEFGEGSNYASLINQSGGVEGDLCLQQFGPVFDNVAQKIIEQAHIACTYDIPEPPDGFVFDQQYTTVSFYATPTAAPEDIPQVANQGACNALTGGWYLDNPQNPTQILLCPATCTVVDAATEGRVEVSFTCDASGPPTN